MVNFTSKHKLENTRYHFIEINNIILIQQTYNYHSYSGSEWIYRYYISKSKNDKSNENLIKLIEDNKLEEITELFRIRDEHNDTSWFQFEPYSLKKI